MLDVMITGADVLDGTGAAPRRADVGITGDRIVDVGNLARAEARQTIDLQAHAGRPGLSESAPGRQPPFIICPGFIDVHSHSDAYLLIEPSAASKVFQGVTTEVVGNCGASAAPLVGAYRMPSDWRDQSYPGTWRTVAEYRNLLDTAKPAVNVVLLTGHNNLRAAVLGYENRPPSAEELDAMSRLLEQCLDEGSRGLSTGLIYPPGLFAASEEITALAAVAARRGGLYASHMRSEGDGLLEAIGEALDIGRAAGLRVEISHLKTSGQRNWDKVDRALGLIREARAQGVAVAADRYPYTAGATDLDVVFPKWAAEGGPEAALARLSDAAERARLRDDLRRIWPEGSLDGIVIGSTRHPDNHRFRGMRLADVARELAVDPVDAILHFADTDRLTTGAFFFGMSDRNMETILAEPYVMLGSDASLRAPTGPLSTDYPHPRAYGAFPRFLRMALDGKTVPLPEAVRKMTSLPAAHFQLHGRGVLAAGYRADLVIFNPREVMDTATYAAPHQLAGGITHVMVNGALTLSDGQLTGQRGGRVL